MVTYYHFFVKNFFTKKQRPQQVSVPSNFSFCVTSICSILSSDTPHYTGIIGISKPSTISAPRAFSLA